MASVREGQMSTLERLQQYRAEGQASERTWYGFEYADLLRATGLTVVSSDEFGSYQGDLVFHVQDSDGRNGLLIQGYGAESWDDDGDLTDVAALADSMASSVVWPTDDGLLAAFEAKVASKNDWWAYSDDEALARAREIAARVDGE